MRYPRLILPLVLLIAVLTIPFSLILNDSNVLAAPDHSYLHIHTDSSRSQDQALDIVILSAGFSNFDEFNRAAWDINNALKSDSFFGGHMDKINIARIKPLYSMSEFGCHISGRLYKCNNYSKIMKLIRSIGGDTAIVIIKGNTNGHHAYYAEDLMSVSSASLHHTIHEFGHSFGHLLDEYVYEGYENKTLPSSWNNIGFNVKSSCSLFDSKYTSGGCYKGAAYGNAYRTTSTSKMRAYSPPFNTIQKDILWYRMGEFINKPSEKQKLTLTNLKSGDNLTSSTKELKFSSGKYVKDFKIVAKNSNGSKTYVNDMVYDGFLRRRKVIGLPGGNTTIKMDIVTNFWDGTNQTASYTFNGDGNTQPPNVREKAVMTEPKSGDFKLPQTLKWTKGKGLKGYYLYIDDDKTHYSSTGALVSQFINKTSGSSNTVSETINKFKKSVSDGTKLYLTLWTQWNDGGWDRTDYHEYTFKNPGQTTSNHQLEVTGKGIKSSTSIYPKLQLYVNKQYQGKYLEMKGKKKQTIGFTKNLGSNDVVSLVFANDTCEKVSSNGDCKSNANYKINRDIVIDRIELDGKTVYALYPGSSDKQDMKSYDVYYDRANRSGGGYYAKNQNWGDMPEGFWDKKYESPKYAITNMWWNGAINIRKK